MKQLINFMLGLLITRNVEIIYILSIFSSFKISDKILMTLVSLIFTVFLTSVMSGYFSDKIYKHSRYNVETSIFTYLLTISL